jgi:hypothetical protein
MSLLRLLTAGKSLVGLKQSDSRYHITRQRLLPEFGAKKNPFKNTGEAAPEAGDGAITSLIAAPVIETSAISTAQTQSSSPDFQSCSIDASRNVCTPGTARPNGSAGLGSPRVSVASDAAAPGDAPPRQVHSRWLDWAKHQVGNLTSLVAKKPAKTTTPSIPKFNKPLVQAELSLERVRVVRNDLSDSDLEVVRTRPQPRAPTPEFQTEAEEKPLPIERPWNRMAGRFFGVGKT